MSIETFGLPSDKKHAGKKKVENVQALRGVACLMVVLYHLGLAERSIFGVHALLARISASWSSGVDLFFVISGFVMVTISNGRFHQPGSSRTFFLRRAARIYPPYWLYALIYIPILLWVPGFV